MSNANSARLETIVTIICRNDELSSTMSWVGCLLKDSELFILFAENIQILLKASVIPILLIFIYLVALLSVSKQPTQLIVQLYSSLRQIIVIHGRLWCSFSFLIKEFRLRTSKFRTKKEEYHRGYLWKPKYLHKSRLVPNLEFLYLSSEYSRKLLWDGFGKYLFRLDSISFYILIICSNWRFKCFKKK